MKNRHILNPLPRVLIIKSLLKGYRKKNKKLLQNILFFFSIQLLSLSLENEKLQRIVRTH